MRPFWDAIAEAMERTGQSLKAACEASGVSYERIKKARGRKSAVDIDDAVMLANHFGYTLDAFVHAENIEDRAEIVQTYNQLSERERRMLRAAREDLGATDPSVAQ